MIKHSFQKGFTLIELIVVLAITSVLIGFSLSGYQGYQKNQYFQDYGTQILTAVQKARNDAINSYTYNASDNYVLGYVFSVYQSANGTRGYCINELMDTASGGPDTGGFTFTGNLSQKVANGYQLPTPSPGVFPCPNLANSGSSYITLDHIAYNIQSNATLKTGKIGNMNEDFFVFENLTGKVFAFDKNGNYLAKSGMNPGNIDLVDNANIIKATVFIPLEENKQPYLKDF